MNMTASEMLLLHSRADRALRALVAENLDDFDMTMMEWLLLGVIAAGPKEGLSMSAIANELDVTLPQVTALMNGVSKKRLVRLKTQRQDRRSRHAMLSAKGADALKRIDKITQDAIDKWLDGFSSEQQNAYLDTVKTLAYRNEAVQ